MNVAAPDHLHVMVHRAVLASRGFEDSWASPIETSLAAIAFARHSPAYRADAVRALERTLRWWRDESPRPISAEVAALTLTARAASDLQRADPKLTEAAASAVDELLARNGVQIPDLHVALCVWALDGLVDDRDQAPWPRVRELSRAARSGVNQPLGTFIDSVAGQVFEPNQLVQDLLSQVGAAPGLSDSCILVWLLTAATDKLAGSLSANDNALQLLVRNRATLVERLVGEVDERTFLAPEVPDFGTDTSSVSDVPNFLTSFEALLVDVSLAAREEADSWLTYSEAEKLFGDNARIARTATLAADAKGRRRAAALLVVLGFALGVVTHFSVTTARIRTPVANASSVSVSSFFFALSVVLGSANKQVALRGPATSFFSILSLTAAVAAIDQSVAHPFVSDLGGLVVGALIASAVSLALYVVARVTRSR